MPLENIVAAALRQDRRIRRLDLALVCGVVMMEVEFVKTVSICTAPIRANPPLHLPSGTRAGLAVVRTVVDDDRQVARRHDRPSQRWAEKMRRDPERATQAAGRLSYSTFDPPARSVVCHET